MTHASTETIDFHIVQIEIHTSTEYIEQVDNKNTSNNNKLLWRMKYMRYYHFWSMCYKFNTAHNLSHRQRKTYFSFG